MTNQQVYWAMQHDWYYYCGTSTIDGTRYVYVHNDEILGDVLQFTDFNKLRIWAGY